VESDKLKVKSEQPPFSPDSCTGGASCESEEWSRSTSYSGLLLCSWKIKS